MKVLKPTAELISALKATCAMFGTKVRVKKLSGSLSHAVRVVLVSGDRAVVRDAALSASARTTTGLSASSPDFARCWNGDQINLYFEAA